jgi:gluconolactonase
MNGQALYEVVDKRFFSMIVPHTEPDLLFSGAKWAEGPVWFGDGDFLLFNDIPNRRTMRWVPGLGVSVFRHDSNYANGNTRDRQGRLVTCEHGGRRVTRTEADGSITVVADSHGGKRLNSPNDVVVKSDHSIWFTDPTYGIISDYEGFKAEPEQDTRNVYRVDGATGEIRAVVTDFLQPNGLAFSPDETVLYVADSGASHSPDAPRHIRAFAVGNDGRLTGGREFCKVDNGVPDGLRVDTDGNVWTSAGDGIHCFSPAGDLLGKIRLPGPVANLTFGGPARNRMFVTANRNVYVIDVAVNGAQRP